MNVKIAWSTPISIGTKSTVGKKLETLDLSLIPAQPGIYIFARRYGSISIPIYIGRASIKGLRNRLKAQMNNHKLIKALEAEKAGDRILIVGTIKSQSKVLAQKKTKLAEQAHIEHALTAGHPLINIQLTKQPAHVIQVDGPKKHNHPFPRIMLLRSKK